jgi:hypothetical protein
MMRVTIRSLKKILKYLAGKFDEGLIISPDKALGLECYVNTDLAGGWWLVSRNWHRS